MQRVNLSNDRWTFRPVSCPGCGSLRCRFIGWRGGEAHRHGAGVKTRIVICRACRLLFANPMPFPSDFSHYDAGYMDAHGPASQRVAAFRDLLLLCGRHGARPPVLDVGCGRGEALIAARDLGWEARGVEPAPELAAQAREQFQGIVDVGSIGELYPSESFGLVLLASVLEHVYDPLALLTEVRRVLKPEGVVYVEVPNERSLLHRLSRLALVASGRNWTLSLSPTFSPYHVVGFSAPSLRHVASLAGLSVIRVRGYPLSWMGPAGTLVERAAAPLRLSAGLQAWLGRA